MNVYGRSHGSCPCCNDGNVNVGAKLDGISFHVNNWILFQCTCSRSKLLSHRPCVKPMNCLSVLKAEFSPTVPILDTSGMVWTDPALLYSAVGKGIRTFTFCFHSPEKSDNAHQQQYPYLQGLIFFMSVLLLVLSLIEKLKIIAIMVKLSVACSTWALWEGKLTSALRQVRSWQEVIFYFLMYMETPVEISISITHTARERLAQKKSFTLNKADKKVLLFCISCMKVLGD